VFGGLTAPNPRGAGGVGSGVSGTHARGLRGLLNARAWASHHHVHTTGVWHTKAAGTAHRSLECCDHLNDVLPTDESFLCVLPTDESFLCVLPIDLSFLFVFCYRFKRNVCGQEERRVAVDFCCAIARSPASSSVTGVRAPVCVLGRGGGGCR